ncbi:MAG TPA: DNA-formamidopyrimidine glycosylase family protein [Egibacteraceae bacterium]|nr:DNA-formamidopyrimidine glycosylase family protein [Egibacteraceae bacterium]
MPELPELQAHADRLTARYAGALLAAFQPLSFTALKTVVPAPDAALGRPLQRVARRGKHLLLAFDDVTFVVHLMQGGRLVQDRKAVRHRHPRGGVCRWAFEATAPLLLTEAGTEHRAGVWVVAGDPLVQPPLAGLGPEADTVDAARLAGLLRAHPMRLHTFLRDQSVLAGLGRRLANEVCHRAGLSPFAPTARLDAAAAAGIVAAIRAAVDEGLAFERGRSDMSAARERPGGVHARTGEPCPVCGDTVRAVAYRDYTVHYCAACQTGGRVLADNTTSRFLK